MERLDFERASDRSTDIDPRLVRVQKMVRTCMQCGTCTASCPNEFAMDATPRKMWRMVQMGRTEMLFSSHTFSLCSACYTCSLRCPRGLPLTEAIAVLKQIAADRNPVLYKKSICFYSNFMKSVRRNGRVREMEFMTLYFASMKNPLFPLQFVPLGMKLMTRGKVSLQVPAMGKGRLNRMFQKAEEIEKEKLTEEQEKQ